MNRYKLCIMASDGTDELEFILFDKKAEHLIRKLVDKLIDSYNKDNVPHEIQALIGQKFTFIVKISPLKSAGSPNNSYEVLSIANQTPDEKSTTNKMRGPSSATSTTLKSLPPLQCCDSTSYSQQESHNEKYDADSKETEAPTKEEQKGNNKRGKTLQADEPEDKDTGSNLKLKQ
ncbi:uncharacterized protein LOC120649024 [Panicum virgatum]|uniref:uncharacterized protein LOC120649024 n=1 Tax=Panicum virgatum TaxID=38727 RepID=UPI0019D53619|nr:uncharacterized protein LOC120649024 [Panicum virgatum]